MAGRGGPKAACGIGGAETEGGILIAGPGPVAHQLQQNIVQLELNGLLFQSGGETLWNGNQVRCDEQ